MYGTGILSVYGGMVPYITSGPVFSAPPLRGAAAGRYGPDPGVGYVPLSVEVVPM